MIAPTPADYESTLARALSRANRAGDALDADPPIPPRDPVLYKAQGRTDEDVPDSVPLWLLDEVNRPPGTLLAEGTAHCSDVVDAEFAMSRLAGALYWQNVVTRRSSGIPLRGLKSKLSKQLSDEWGPDARTTKRYINVGATFDIDSLAKEKGITLCYVALTAEEPLVAYELAIRKNWTAKGLAENLRTHEEPPIRERLIDDKLGPDFDLDHEARMIRDALDTARQMAGRGGLGLLRRVKVRVVAEFDHGEAA